MSNLTKIVPPLELCKKIPEGEFKNCALYWDMLEGVGMDVFPGECGACPSFKTSPKNKNACPAPTLQEIMEELEEFEIWKNNISDEVVIDSEFVQYTDRNPATAAMRLWLKLKGIEA